LREDEEMRDSGRISVGAGWLVALGLSAVLWVVIVRAVHGEELPKGCVMKGDVMDCVMDPTIGSNLVTITNMPNSWVHARNKAGGFWATVSGQDSDLKTARDICGEHTHSVMPLLTSGAAPMCAYQETRLCNRDYDVEWKLSCDRIDKSWRDSGAEERMSETDQRRVEEEYEFVDMLADSAYVPEPVTICSTTHPCGGSPPSVYPGDATKAVPLASKADIERVEKRIDCLANASQHGGSGALLMLRYLRKGCGYFLQGTAIIVVFNLGRSSPDILYGRPLVAAILLAVLLITIGQGLVNWEHRS
jgi:hypothetical protein